MPESRIATIDGVDYVLGSAGSFVLACPSCGRECFRQIIHNLEWEVCFWCSDIETGSGTQLEMVRADELKTRWQPLWGENEVD